MVRKGKGKVLGLFNNSFTWFGITVFSAWDFLFFRQLLLLKE